MTRPIMIAVTVLVASLAVAGVASLANAIQPGPIQDEKIARHLGHVSDIISRAHDRLNAIQADLAADPGPINDPAVQAALQDIIDKANSIEATANSILTPCDPAGCPP